MVSTSNEVLRKLSRSNRNVISPLQDPKLSEDHRLKKLERNKLKYRQRKAAGLCAQGNCPAKTELGHTHCLEHLRRMAKRAEERIAERKAQGLCTYCGKRPQFWGRRCILCRQLSAKNPLPSGARRALRLFREAESQRLYEEIQENARKAALKLLSSKRVQGKRAKALRLYVGVDRGKWRTYREVAKLMNLSVERVRQLLLPSKLNLSSLLSGRVPWPALKRHKSISEFKILPSVNPTCTRCQSIALKRLDHESCFYLYTQCGLPNVTLFGPTVEHCPDCNDETVSIPHISDLHRKLARAVLMRPASLTGRELQFLRTVAGLSPFALAEQLGVAIHTIEAWEGSAVLRGPNDLAARMVLASLILSEEDCRQMVKTPGSIRPGKSEPSRVVAYWINEKSGWVVTSPDT